MNKEKGFIQLIFYQIGEEGTSGEIGKYHVACECGKTLADAPMRDALRAHINRPPNL